ncbi:MAG: pyruvate, phosphate dikinase [Verrucomicrobiota bacterium]|nr:pyruvate, phosphate dikinase [Verrucomicrobiota bacterium]
MSETKYVYFFGGGKAEGNTSQKELLGGKGANLAEMTSIGLPVPPGFTVSTETCAYFSENNRKYPDTLKEQVAENLKKLEDVMGAKLGDPENPLLVSVRSGAAQSMPGMMDTVLNLGMSPAAVEGITKKTGNARFAWDSYRRFMQMFGDVVMGVPHHDFEEALQSVKDQKKVENDTDLDADDLKLVVDKYNEVYRNATGEDFPDDPEEQLFKSMAAVFGSWDNDRAIKYRQMNDIRGLLGTAVNIQAMVYGNMGETSGTGVAFTRDPSTGENKFYGEYLMNAQGEDVVAGIRTPKPIDALKNDNEKVYNELVEIRHILEEHYKDMQDLEFTIQEGTLYMLQTRTGKRTVFSWLKSQVDMVNEGLITKEEAVSRVPAGEFGKLFAPILDADDIAAQNLSPIATGLNASPGGASGKAVFTANEAEEMAAKGEKIILVRIETSPEDIGGMGVAEGILTARGGMTSHAAVVARGMGCPCVSGAGDIKIDYANKSMSVGDTVIKQGDTISIDGFLGNVYETAIKVKPSEIVQVLNGEMKADESELYQNYSYFMEYVDELRVLGIRTNADTPEDTTMAVKFGAEGIGLCRTEHMFFEGEKIVAMREMILAETLEERKKALAKLLPMQKKDFEGIYKALNGLPATIRLLDPPLHEFLPHDEKGQQEVADQLGVKASDIKDAVEDLHEFNPMLGFRGCRLAVVYPEILRMQIRAIMESAIEVSEQGIEVHPEIMIPLIGNVKELDFCKKHALEVIKDVFAETGKEIDYKIGTMIEIPRAALTADEVAESAEFFSFGTNDLTQMTCGFSRDDSAKFLTPYVNDIDKAFYEYDPFEVLDQTGVGKLVKMAVDLGKQTRPDIKLGICGEHGGEPKTVEFCHKLGLTYVSCSPYRVPIARLAAAQATIK